jgi:hypothetical protein
MTTDFIILNERKKIFTLLQFSVVAPEDFLFSSFLIFWWGLVKLVTTTTVRIC